MGARARGAHAEPRGAGPRRDGGLVRPGHGAARTGPDPGPEAVLRRRARLLPGQPARPLDHPRSSTWRSSSPSACCWASSPGSARGSSAAARIAPARFLAALTVLLTIRGLHAIACAILAGGLAYRAAPRIRAHARRFRRLVRLSLPGLAVAVAALVAASLGRERLAERSGLASLPPAPADAPNVLLIVLDTVRADHLSLYGYERADEPESGPPGAPGRPLRAGAVDGALDAPVARQHVHRPLAARAVRRAEGPAGRPVPDPGRVAAPAGLRHRRLRRQHDVLQRRDGAGPRLRPLRGPHPDPLGPAARHGAGPTGPRQGRRVRAGAGRRGRPRRLAPPGQRQGVQGRGHDQRRLPRLALRTIRAGRSSRS